MFTGSANISKSFLWYFPIYPYSVFPCFSHTTCEFRAIPLLLWNQSRRPVKHAPEPVLVWVVCTGNAHSMLVRDIGIEAHGKDGCGIDKESAQMPKSKPKGSYHVDKEFVDASHPDQSGFRQSRHCCKHALQQIHVALDSIHHYRIT